MLKTHKSGRFEVTRAQIEDYKGSLKELEERFNQVVFDNPEFIFISHWTFEGVFVVEWQWMPWRQNDEQASLSAGNHSAK